MGVGWDIPDGDLGQGGVGFQPGFVGAGGDADSFVGLAGEGDDECGGVGGECGVDEGHLGDLADCEEGVGVGVDEHPAAVEVEALHC